MELSLQSRVASWGEEERYSGGGKGEERKGSVCVCGVGRGGGGGGEEKSSLPSKKSVGLLNI